MIAHGTLRIELEENEVMHLWNIVMFAMDLHSNRAKEGKPCMTNDELYLAKQLIKITEDIK